MPDHIAEPAAQLRTKVAVVTVNWNRWQLSLECLKALRTTEGIGWHLYIVDNASTDGSGEHLKDLGPDVTYVQSPNNGGWSGGTNLGVKQGLSDGYARFLLLNNDAKVGPHTLKTLNDEFVKRPDRPIIGPIQILSDGSGFSFTGSVIDQMTGMPSHPARLAIDSPEAKDLRDWQPSAFVQGSALFASADHFKAVGLFDDRFYLNYDETDWCFRARKAGFGVILVKSAQVVHDGSASIGGLGSPIHFYFMIRNGLLFSELHGSFSQRLAYYKQVFRDGMKLSGRSSKMRRLRALLLGQDPLMRIYRTAVFDYVFRRFGDCPPLIRSLQASGQNWD